MYVNYVNSVGGEYNKPSGILDQESESLHGCIEVSARLYFISSETSLSCEKVK